MQHRIVIPGQYSSITVDVSCPRQAPAEVSRNSYSTYKGADRYVIVTLDPKQVQALKEKNTNRHLDLV